MAPGTLVSVPPPPPSPGGVPAAAGWPRLPTVGHAGSTFDGDARAGAGAGARSSGWGWGGQGHPGRRGPPLTRPSLSLLRERVTASEPPPLPRPGGAEGRGGAGDRPGGRAHGGGEGPGDRPAPPRPVSTTCWGTRAPRHGLGAQGGGAPAYLARRPGARPVMTEERRPVAGGRDPTLSFAGGGLGAGAPAGASSPSPMPACLPGGRPQTEFCSLGTPWLSRMQARNCWWHDAGGWTKCGRSLCFRSSRVMKGILNTTEGRPQTETCRLGTPWLSRMQGGGRRSAGAPGASGAAAW